MKKLSDEKIKNCRLADFIGNHTILISLSVILIGLFFIFYANDSHIEINRITINPNSAYSIRDYRSSEELDKSKLNISINNIYILIKYNTPVMRRSSFEINKILLYTHNTKFDNVDDVTLQLSGRDSIIYSPDRKSNNFGSSPNFFAYTPEVFRFSKNDSGSYDIPELSEFESIFFKAVSPSYDDTPFIFIEPNSDNNFYFKYSLTYKESGKIINLVGNATTLYPIRCSNYVEALNIQINKSILFLTGTLIILGTFPFSVALKHLFKKE